MYFDILIGWPISSGVPTKEIQIFEHLFVYTSAKYKYISIKLYTNCDELKHIL